MMAFEKYDLRGFLFLVLFATIPMIASKNIDCHGRGFHCVNSTHFMICVDLGIGISTTIDDFIIPCPPTTVCHKHNIFECEFPKFEIATPPLQVIGVSEQSDTSEATVVSTSAASVPLFEVSRVTKKPVSILLTPEEITPVPELEVLKSVKEYTETYSETSTTMEVTIHTTPSSVISKKVNLDDFITKYDRSVVESLDSDTVDLEPTVETSLDKAVTLTLPDISISIHTTTFASGPLDSTLRTPAPADRESSVVQNSYRKDNSIINQMNDNNILNQNDTGLNIISEFATTKKMQVYSLDTIPKSVTSIENTDTSTETTFIISEANVTKTTEMTPIHENEYTKSIITEKSTKTSPINSLLTTDKLVDKDPVLIIRTVNSDTDIVDNVESSTTTTTSINLGVGSTNDSNFKLEILPSVFDMTINDTYSEPSATTISLNVSGAFKNHSFVSNGLAKPTPNNGVLNTITVKNIDDQIPNDSNITQEIMVHNDLPYNANNTNATNTDIVQDKVNTTTIYNNDINKKIYAISNETVVIPTSGPIITATDSLNLIKVPNLITKTNEEPKQTKPILFALNISADNISSDIKDTPVNNMSTIRSLVENVTDANVQIIKNINMSVTDLKNENKTTIPLNLTENDETKLVTNQNESTIQHQAFTVPNEVSKIVKDSKIGQPTSTTPNETEKVSAVTPNSLTIVDTTEVAELVRTVAQDEVNHNSIIDVTCINETYNGENTTPMSTLRTADSSGNLQNITDSTILKDYNTTTTQDVVIQNNTDTEYTPEVPIIQKISVSSTTVATTAFITNIIPTTTSILQNEVFLFNNDNKHNETTLTPLPTTVIESQTVPYETTTIFPIPQDTAPKIVTESTLGSVGTTKAPFIDVLRKTKPTTDDQTNYLNSFTEPSVDFSTSKAAIVEELRHVKEPILKQYEKSGPTLNFENVTTSPLVKTVPSIYEYTTTKLLNENVDSLAQVHGVVMPPEVFVQSTTSVTNSPQLRTAQIPHEEVTSTTETSKIYTHSHQNAPRIDDASTTTAVEINQTSSFIILQNAIKRTIPQGPITYTTTGRSTNVDETILIQKPILKVFEELLHSTPFEGKKTLPSVTVATTPTSKENVTMNSRDNTLDNLTNTEDLKTAMNLESKNSSIFKQEVVAPLEDVITTIIERNEQLLLIKELPETSTFVYDNSKNSPPALKISEITTEPQTANTLTTLALTFKISDASFHYISPNIRSTEQPLNQGSPNISTFALNEVTTQQVLNSVTPPDSMVETIQVNGGQISETSHLGLVLNDIVIKNLTVNTSYGLRSAKHIDREYIENVTSINNVEDEATLNFTKLDDIDENIKLEKDSTLNNGDKYVNKTVEIFSNKADASQYHKLSSEIINKGLSTESPVEINLPHEDPPINNNTLEYEKTTKTPHAGYQYVLQPNRIEKESSETVSSANTDVNLEINNVNFVKTSITNVLQDFKTPNELKTSTTLNNQKVNLEKHKNTQTNRTDNEMKLNTTKTSDFIPTVTNKQLEARNKDKNNTIAAAIPFNCTNHTRGKYADKKDCRKFYTCVGNLQPLQGICPNNTVFSDINKQCTRNLSHCVRNNQFRCLLEGRFNDFVKDNIYYICIKNTQNKFIRYKFQCNSDYNLNKISVKCEKKAKNSSQISSSVSENSRVFSDQSTSGIEQETRKTFNTNFECEDEGSFSHSNDCSKYYECTKVKDVYRRKLKKCVSDEVYDKEKKKCVKSDSSEC